MNRRTLLRRAAALGAIGLAGCTGDGAPPGDDGTSTPPDDGEPTPTDDETPTTEPPEPVEIADFDFAVTGRDSSSAPTASVSFDASADEVEFAGTIQGSDGCKTAALDAIDYDRGADEVTLSVITKDREGAGDACTQALVFIDYEATVRFTGGIPSRAVVTHNGEEMASAAMDG